MIKRITLLTLAVLVLLPLLSGCSWIGPVFDAWKTVKGFLVRVDDQVVAWCDDGYLPPYVCAQWTDLKGELGERYEWLKDKWGSLKSRIIDFVKKFLDGSFYDVKTPPAYTGDKIERLRPDPDARTAILDAAAAMAERGFIDYDDLAALQAAAQ